MEDTSLDEFLDDREEDTPAGHSEDERVATDDPATGVARWISAGEQCPACGESVKRLWDDDGEAVCQSCKQW